MDTYLSENGDTILSIVSLKEEKGDENDAFFGLKS